MARLRRGAAAAPPAGLAADLRPARPNSPEGLAESGQPRRPCGTRLNEVNHVPEHP